MRSGIEDLGVAKTIQQRLPSVLQEDRVIADITSSLDSVIAPVYATLESLESYFDPMLAPMDFVQWLATWVGVALDETWSEESTRNLIRRSLSLFRIRGTVLGLKEHLAIYTGVEAEVVESGSVEVSSTPTRPTPDAYEPHLKVVVELPKDSKATSDRIEAIVNSSKPANVPSAVEVRITP
ncbi:MAG: phage tail protein [Actinomycetota bacterium]|nr:phage tail protein [Actinomycetota bacterium]